MRKILLGLLCCMLYYNISAQDQIIKLPSGKKVVLYSDKTWDYFKTSRVSYDISKIKDNEIPSFLNQGIIVKASIIKEAILLYYQGWRYQMPIPKSRQACWGNCDGRTTWWYGYWYNIKNNSFSRSKPKQRANGLYIGDDQNQKGYYRKGGSPSKPTKLHLLLSFSDG
ncbi:hypothetical protein E0494_03990 [Marinilabiliaceae bacterium JC040]|nr:hypothetical protein [Marinilabiliaceae bacterium JC040]